MYIASEKQTLAGNERAKLLIVKYFEIFSELWNAVSYRLFPLKVYAYCCCPFENALSLSAVSEFHDTYTETDKLCGGTLVVE